MRTKMMKKCALLLLGTLLCTTIKGQSRDTLFKPLYETTKVKSLRSTFTHSDSITLDGLGTIYALAIDATVTQPCESSFVRVVLEDKEGHQYLVAECDRFRYDEDVVTLDQFCQETASLEGIMPVCLRCYTAGGAALEIKNIYSSGNRPIRGTATKQEQDELRKAQVQDVVNRINNFNIKHKRRWIAGPTEKALLPYNDKQSTFQCNELYDAYIANLDYYIDGIYQMGGSNATGFIPDVEDTSYVIECFDWRDRHGKNWITPVKNQGHSSYCTAFATVSVAEAISQLYYNQLLNIDLSERDICAFSGIDYYNGGTIPMTLNYWRDYGIIDESSYPFILDCDLSESISNRPIGQECIRISDYKRDSNIVVPPLYIPYYGRCISNDCTFDDVKRDLIFKGPGVSGIGLSPITGQGHSMALIGYGKVHPDSTYVVRGYMQVPALYMQIEDDDLIANRTYWIFKNSYHNANLTQQEAYPMHERECDDIVKIVFLEYQYLRPFYFAELPITSLTKTDADIVCEDADGDGYFNWGIGPIPSSLPIWAPREEDSNDDNTGVGPMDSNGFPRHNDPYILPIIIDHDTIISGDRTIYQNYEVTNHATLTITGNWYFRDVFDLWLDSGCKLKVDGGHLYKAKLFLEDHTSIEIDHGGEIMLDHNADNCVNGVYEIPQSCELLITHGRFW